MVIRSEPYVAVALLALVAAFTGVEFSSSTLQEQGTTTPAQALQDLLLLAAMGILLTAIAYVCRQLHQHGAAPAAAGAAGTEVAGGVIFAAVGILLQFLLHDDVTAGPCALGAAAVLVLPAAATVSFFLGTALIFVQVHGGDVVAGDGPPVLQKAVWILSRVTLGAAAVVVTLMALVLCYT